MCCGSGSNKAKNNAAPQVRQVILTARTTPTLLLSDVKNPVTQDGKYLLEYLGPNVGSETWYGPSGTRYQFGRNPKHLRSYVAAGDVAALLEYRLFKVVPNPAPAAVKTAPAPAPIPAPVTRPAKVAPAPKVAPAVEPIVPAAPLPSLALVGDLAIEIPDIAINVTLEPAQTFTLPVSDVTNPATLTVMQIRKLHLTPSEWDALAATERAGKNRVQVISYAENQAHVASE